MSSAKENPQDSDVQALELWTARQVVDLLVTQNQIEPLPGGAEALVEQFSAKLLRVLEGRPEAESFRSLDLDTALTPLEVARLLRFGWFFGEPQFKNMGVHTYDPHGQDSFLVSPIDVLLSHATANLSPEEGGESLRAPSPHWFVAHLDQIIDALPYAIGQASHLDPLEVRTQLAEAIAYHSFLPQDKMLSHLAALRCQVSEGSQRSGELLARIDRVTERISQRFPS